jgi:hypothetical protein
MKARISRAELCALGLAIGAFILPAVAEDQASIEAQTYGGIKIFGTVGAVYAIQQTLTPPHGWQCIDILQLPRSPYVWVDTAEPARGHRFYRITPGPGRMVWIPPGTFAMGTPECDALYRGQAVVTLTRGFFMGRYEVTQGEYSQVMGTNPSEFTNGVDGSAVFGSAGPVTNELSHPVEQVSWSDATNYCAQLTAREYEAGRLPSGWSYRLPTEAEWEYGKFRTQRLGPIRHARKRLRMVSRFAGSGGGFVRTYVRSGRTFVRERAPL